MLYYSGHIFGVARRAYERSRSNGSEAMPAIVLSTMALECFVNETVQRLSKDMFREENEAFTQAAYWLQVVESKRASTLERIEALHLAFTKSRMHRGSQPHQDICFLYQLRNELVHRKPEGAGEWDPNDQEREYQPHKYVKALASRGIIELPSPKAPPVWSQFVLNESTAKWAFNTAVAGVHFIVGLLPESNLEHTTRFMVQQIEKIE